MDALQNAADPFIRNPSGAFESDHYAPRFIVLNLRDPAVRDYWLRSWRAAHDEIGLDAIFLDSSFNLSSDKLHFKAAAEPAAAGATADQTHLLGRTRPPVEPPAAVLSQYRAHLELMVQMQRMGYQYCGEDVGVFGVHRHGPGIEARLDNLFLWPECLANFDAAAVEAAGHQADDVFFRALACRMMWMIYWDIRRNRLSFHHGGVRGPADEPTAWHLSVLAAFNEADAHMLRRRILPEELGVLWEGEGGREVLWSFADLELPLPVPRTIRDLLAEEGEAEATPPASALRARRRHVYLLTPPGG